MLRELKGTQRMPRVLAFRVNGTGTAAILEGAFDGTLTDNGTGDYTITFAKAFARKPVVVGTCATDDCYLETLDADNTVSAVHVKTKINADTATDAIFHLMVMGWDVVDQY